MSNCTSEEEEDYCRRELCMKDGYAHGRNGQQQQQANHGCDGYNNHDNVRVYSQRHNTDNYCYYRQHSFDDVETSNRLKEYEFGYARQNSRDLLRFDDYHYQKRVTEFRMC